MFTAANSPTTCRSIHDRLKQANTTRFRGFADTRSCATGISQWNFGEAILDSAHDALPIYTKLERDNVSAIIDLNNRRSGKLVYNEMEINSDGIPVCPIGRKMVCWGKSNRNRIKWRCPAKVGKWECPRVHHLTTAERSTLQQRTMA